MTATCQPSHCHKILFWRTTCHSGSFAWHFEMRLTRKCFCHEIHHPRTFKFELTAWLLECNDVMCIWLHIWEAWDNAGFYNHKMVSAVYQIHSSETQNSMISSLWGSSKLPSAKIENHDILQFYLLNSNQLSCYYFYLMGPFSLQGQHALSKSYSKDKE